MDSDSEKRNSSLVRTGVKVEPEEAIDIDEDAWLVHSSKDVKDENEETVIKEEEEEEEEYGDEKHQISSAFFSWKRGLDSATAYRCTWCKDGETKVFSNLPDFKAHALLRHESQHTEPEQRLKLGITTCLICGDRLVKGTKQLQRHLELRHCSTILEDYFSRHVHGRLEGKDVKKCLVAVQKMTWGNDLYFPRIFTCVGNMCRFKCVECGKTFQNFALLSRHGQSCGSHQKKPTLDEPGTVVRAVGHKCALCNLVLLCDKRIISTHLGRCHTIGLAEYLPTKKIVKSDKELEVDKLKREVPVVPTLKGAVCPPTALPREKVTAKVANLCTFQCPACKHVVPTFGALIAHFRKRQCLGPRHRLSSFRPEFCIEARYHICCVCANRILCDKKCIFQHVRKNHKISREAYRSKAEELAASFGKEKLFGREEKMEETKHLRELTVFKGGHPDPDSLDDSQVTNLVASLCLYKCRRCQASVATHHGLRKHMKTIHSKDEAVAKEDGLWKARYHRCHVCEETLLCSKPVINDHVRSRHKMRITVEDYKEKAKVEEEKRIKRLTMQNC